jgi:hypothetical protein
LKNQTDALLKMKIKPSRKPGHVLVDLDENGTRLLANDASLMRPSCVVNSERFSAELYERATTPLRIDDGGEWRNFGINE